MKAPRVYVILGPDADGDLIPISAHLDLMVALAAQTPGTIIRAIAGGRLGAEVYHPITTENVGQYVTCAVGEHRGVVGYYDDDVSEARIAFCPGAFAGGYHELPRSWFRLATAAEIVEHARANKHVSACYDVAAHEAGTCACATRGKEFH